MGKASSRHADSSPVGPDQPPATEHGTAEMMWMKQDLDYPAVTTAATVPLPSVLESH